MTEIKRPTFYSHFGVDNRMRRSAIVDFMQDCCTVSRQADKAIGPLMNEGKALLYVAYRQLDILSEPLYREELTVRTGIFESKRIYGRRCTVITGSDGTVRAMSYLISTLVDPETRKPINLPEEINNRFEFTPAPDMELTPRRLRLPEVTPEEFPAFTALRCQADTNGHVNNARYLDLGDELIPRDREIRRIRCEYKASFMPGDKIIPHVYRTDTSTFITLSNEDGLLCSVMEYVYKD